MASNLKQLLKLPVYLDYQSTTPVDPIVFEEIRPYFTEKFGNPHSKSHCYGWEAEAAVEKAREEIAAVIGAGTSEIIFTSGATESNNLAIKGLALRYKDSKKNHIITVTTEHKCVLESCRHLEKEGFKVTYLPVNKNGLINTATLKDAITENTFLVSVMAVNNEIGVIQPIEEIGTICRQKGVVFHTDAAQAFGKIALNVNKMNIDLMSISAHKIYGPKGIGALYIRKKPRINVMPLMDGGGQEMGLRSGTLPTPLIVGFGVAAVIANERMTSESQRIQSLTDKLYQGIIASAPDIFLNGDKKHRIAGNLNLSFAYIEGESMITAIRDLAVSSGSACASANLEPSYVLKAIGVSEELANTSIRFGIGRFTTEKEIDFAIKTVLSAIDKLRNINPLWKATTKQQNVNTK